MGINTPIRKYTIAYTAYHPTDPDIKPIHKKTAFESELDLLAAADQGMCAVYDKWRTDDPSFELLFRSITLDNAHEVYNEIKPMHGDQDG